MDIIQLHSIDCVYANFLWHYTNVQSSPTNPVSSKNVQFLRLSTWKNVAISQFWDWVATNTSRITGVSVGMCSHPSDQTRCQGPGAGLSPGSHPLSDTKVKQHLLQEDIFSPYHLCDCRGDALQSTVTHSFARVRHILASNCSYVTSCLCLLHPAAPPFTRNPPPPPLCYPPGNSPDFTRQSCLQTARVCNSRVSHDVLLQLINILRQWLLTVSDLPSLSSSSFLFSLCGV